MSEYTPTTEVVQDAVTFPRRRLGEPRDMTPRAFDRWLAAHDQEVAARALRDAADGLDNDPASSLWEMWDSGIGVYKTPIEWIRDRADRIGGTR